MYMYLVYDVPNISELKITHYCMFGRNFHPIIHYTFESPGFSSRVAACFYCDRCHVRSGDVTVHDLCQRRGTVMGSTSETEGRHRSYGNQSELPWLNLSILSKRYLSIANVDAVNWLWNLIMSCVIPLLPSWPFYSLIDKFRQLLHISYYLGNSLLALFYVLILCVNVCLLFIFIVDCMNHWFFGIWANLCMLFFKLNRLSSVSSTCVCFGFTKIK